VGGGDAGGGEALPHEKLIGPRVLGLIGELGPAVQLLAQRLFYHRPFTELAIDLAERLGGHLARNPDLEQLAHDAVPAAAFDRGCGPRERSGDPGVVECTAFEEPFDRLGNLVGRVAPVLQAGADPLYRQLASREHPQAFGVGARLIHRTG